MLAVDATQALSDYLAMGPERSLRRLSRHYDATLHDGAPAFDTIKAWSGKFKWHTTAGDFDKRASQRLIERTQSLVVARNMSRLEGLDLVATQCLEDAAAIRVDSYGASAQDKKALISAAIETIKLIEVLTGGVSDRTAKVTALATEAVSALRELEDRARRRELVIDVTPDAAGHTDNPLEPAPADPPNT